MTKAIAASTRPGGSKEERVVIRRARIEDIDAVCDQAYGLAAAAGSAGRWSEAAYRSYIALDAGGGSMQARALFVGCAVPGAPEVLTKRTRRSEENLIGLAAFSVIPGVGECALDNMVVAEPWRRQGIGARLLDAGLLWCRSHSGLSVWLEVRASNAGAIRMYERAGFSVMGRRQDYYHDPVEAAIEMQKVLEAGLESGNFSR